MALSGRQEEAAALVAADLLTDPQICERVGIKSRDTLHRWKHDPAFVARVETIRAALRAKAREHGIALVENRVAALNDRWERMQAVIKARAEDESMTAPGHATGLLVRKYKAIGSGEFAEKVEEYEVDTGLLRELREHEKQAAQELGQWMEKSEVKHVTPIAITSITAVQPAVRATGDADAA